LQAYYVVAHKLALLVLRGGGDRPNYDTVSVAIAEQALAKAGLAPNIVVDASQLAYDRGDAARGARGAEGHALGAGGAGGGVELDRVAIQPGRDLIVATEARAAWHRAPLRFTT
jgi:hypothetical protein